MWGNILLVNIIMEIIRATKGLENLDQKITPEEILRSTAFQFNKLDEEANEFLYQRKTSEYVRLLRERAGLIVGLPSKIETCLEMNGESFPEDKMDDLCFMAQSAKKALKDGGLYKLSFLLTSQGMTVDDPNYLEELINDIYPKKEP